MCRFIFGFLCFILVCQLGLWAQNGPELSADEPISISRDGTELIAKGHAQLVQDRFFVEADEIIFNKNAGGGNAKGEVQIDTTFLRIVTDQVDYRMQDKDLLAEEFRMAISPIFIGGDAIQGNADAVFIENASLYWQEPDAFSPNLNVKEATYYPNEKTVQAKSVSFRVGKLPFFYLPAIYARAFERPFSLSTKIGYRKSLGLFLKSNTLLTVLPGLQLGALADFYGKRGLLVGPCLSHDTQLPWLKATGNLDTGWIHDYGNRGQDIRGQAIPPNRGFVHLREKADIQERLALTAKIDYWSDSDVTRDFRPDYFWNNQQPDNFLEAVYNGNGYYLSLFTRFRPNNFQDYVERLPELSLSWTPSQLWQSGLYQEAKISFAYLKKNSPFTSVEESAKRLDAYYGLFSPIHLIKNSLTITPTVGARLTHYQDIHKAVAPSKGGDYTRFLGQLGMDLELKSYGIWDIESKRFRINGLRHKLTPVIQYRYIPSAQQGEQKIPRLDENPFPTYLPSIDLGQRRDIDFMENTHVLRLGLQNLLETRAQGYGSHSLASLDFYQDIRFSPKPNGHTLSDFYTQLALTPWDWFAFHLYSRIDTQKFGLKELNTSFQIFDGVQWQIALGTSFLKDETHQYSLSGAYKLDERHRLRASIRYDAKRGSFTEQCYSLWLRIGHAWVCEPYLARKEGASREQGWELGMRVDLIN